MSPHPQTTTTSSTKNKARSFISETETANGSACTVYTLTLLILSGGQVYIISCIFFHYNQYVFYWDTKEVLWEEHQTDTYCRSAGVKAAVLSSHYQPI